MKVKIKNKGFTLIETVAIIIILGIMMTLAIVGYSKYVKKSQKDYYAKQEDLVTQAGRDFYNDNRGKLPTELGEENCVLLGNLIKNKYIDPVKDYNKKNCSTTKSKVCAQKISLTKYSYTTILDCGDEYVTPIITKPEITFKLENKDFTYVNDTEQPYNGVENQIYEIKMHIKDKKYNLKSYKYVIHKVGNNNPYLVIGPASIPSDKKEYDVTIPLNVSGTFYIEGISYNTNGGKVTQKSKKIKLKFSKLECENSIVFSDTGAEWTNKNINTVITKNDLVDYYYAEIKSALTDEVIQKIGKEANKYKNQDKNLNVTLDVKDNTVKKYYIQVVPYDNNGKNYSCVKKSPVYQVDKIKPKCTSSSNKSGWTKDNVIINVQCEDMDSKCKSNSKNITLSNNFNGNYVATTEDNATNSKECSPIKVQIDKTPPNVVKMESTNNVAKEQTVTLTCQDNYGISGYYYGTDTPSNSTSYSTNATEIAALQKGNLKKKANDGKTYYLSCKDYAGNITTKSLTFYKTTLTPGNDSTVTPTSVVTQSGQSFALPTPTKVTGYTFTSWNTKADGSGTDKTSTYKPTNNSTLYGKWTANEYKVTLDQNGDSGGTEKIYERYNTGYYLDNKKMSTTSNNIIIPKRTGYTFNGYYTSKTGGTQYINEKGYLTTSASTKQFTISDSNFLYAQWTANKYEVVLLVNKGNLLKNYDFKNKTPIDSKKCGFTGIHLNEWPIYDRCTPLGNGITYTGSNNSNPPYVTLSYNSQSDVEFSQELSNVLQAGHKYLLRLKVRRTQGDLQPCTGIVGNCTKKICSMFIDDNMYNNALLCINPTKNNKWETFSWVFQLADDYSYDDRYINGYPNISECPTNQDNISGESYNCRQQKYFNSGRPKLSFNASYVGTGKIDISNIELYEAVTLKYKKEYGTKFTNSELETPKKNGYDFGGWYKDENLQNKLEGNDNIVFNEKNADCYNLDKPNNSNSICYIYAGWKEKTYIRNGKTMKNSDVMTTTCSNFKGWNEMPKKALNTEDAYLLDATDNSGIEAFGGFTKSYNISDNSNDKSHKSPFGNHYITLNNSEHPNYNNSKILPGYGGFCQGTVTIKAGETKSHVITMSMGTGLYLHYKKVDGLTMQWKTDNEGTATTQTYVYTIKNTTSSSKTYKPCVYFSPIIQENEKIRMRDHMSAYIDSSGIYNASNVGQSNSKGEITLTCAN